MSLRRTHAIATLLCLIAARGEPAAQGNYFEQPVPQAPTIALLLVEFADQTEPGIDPDSLSSSSTLRDKLSTMLVANSYDDAFQPTFYSPAIIKLSRNVTWYQQNFADPFDNAAAVYQDVLAEKPVELNLDAFDYRIMFMTKSWTENLWNGLSQDGLPVAIVTNSNPNPAVQNNASPDLTEHELGHNFGLEHAMFYESPSPTNPLATPGWLFQYGDRFDIMGQRNPELVPGTRHLNPHSKHLLGWLSLADTFSPTTTGLTTLRLQAIEDEPSGEPGTYSALRLWRGGNSEAQRREYWIYYRADQPFASNGPLVTDVEGVGTVLFDMRPDTTSNNGGTEDWKDAALPDEETSFEDLNSGIRLWNLGVNERSVDVLVQVLSGAPVLGHDQLPLFDILQPPRRKEITSNQVTYEITAHDPDVGTSHGAGIQSITLKLMKYGVTGSPAASQTFTAPFQQSCVFTVDRQQLGVQDGTWLLGIVIDCVSGHDRSYSYMHWLL